jgi:hypothetical protein
MAATDRKVHVYQELAEREHLRGATQARDRFLILAADAALAAGHNDQAEQLRARLLEYNPHHLLKPFPSLADALKSSEVYGYVADLRSSYPPEEAERLLASLRPGEEMPRSEAPEPPIFDAAPATPATLPDPPPLQTFRFAAQPETLPSAAEMPEAPEEAGSPFGGLRGSPSASPSPAPLPARRPTPLPGAPAPVAGEEAPDTDDGDERPAGVGPWLSDTLFVVVLLVGLVWVGYTLARPFLSLPDAPFK